MQSRYLGPCSTLLGAILLAQPTSAQVAPGQHVRVSAEADKTARSPGKDPAVSAIEQWVVGLSQATLDNGLRVVMAPDPDSPTVSICVTYDVGSRNEILGQSGFAHLFEHVMFQGSRNVAKGEHFQLVTARGGQLNGSTSADRTNYFETLPANELALGLWLEADRMRWLDLSAENFENQRAVVKEEYRMRVENAAYRPALIELERQVFLGYFPYEHPTIGSMADLGTAKLDWVRDFHSKYYRPNNAVLTLSGGFEPDQAMELVGKYFGPIEKGVVPQFVEPVLPPPRTRENRAEMVDVNAKTKAVMLGYRIPPSRTNEHYALEMVARVLADGESSLLYNTLVREKALARDVSVFTYDHRGPDALVITVELNDGVDPRKVEALIDAALTGLKTKGPAESVLSRAKQRTKSAFVFGLQSNQSRATTLGEYAVFYQNPRLIARDLEALLKVDAASIQQAVARYLTQESRSVITVNPQAAPTTQTAPVSSPGAQASVSKNASTTKESR